MSSIALAALGFAAERGRSPVRLRAMNETLSFGGMGMLIVAIELEDTIRTNKFQ